MLEGQVGANNKTFWLLLLLFFHSSLFRGMAQRVETSRLYVVLSKSPVRWASSGIWPGLLKISSRNDKSHFSKVKMTSTKWHIGERDPFLRCLLRFNALWSSVLRLDTIYSSRNNSLTICSNSPSKSPITWWLETCLDLFHLVVSGQTWIEAKSTKSALLPQMSAGRGYAFLPARFIRKSTSSFTNYKLS